MDKGYECGQTKFKKIKLNKCNILKKGNILKNPNRTTKANKKLKGGKGKKFLTPEKQIWHNLDIIEWNNSRALFPGEGYKFKNNRIKILIAKFYENYGDAAFKTRKLV